MTDSNIVMETIDLTRDFGGKVVLEDVSLTVGAGEILALLGPNGVGKSTLMKLISGLLMPSRGQAKLWGESSWPPSTEMYRVACVLDGMSPPSGTRVREIMSLKSCVSPRFDWKLATSLCEQHQISTASRWRTLSKGQKRWVLLVSAIASGADLLVLDEPADGLDVATRLELYGLLREQSNDRGVTSIIASHIIADVERIADDVVILANGRVRLHSPLEQLRDEVFEVELPLETDDSLISPMAEVISSRRASDALIAVIRFRSLHLAEQEFPGEISRRRVSLEDLYLAYTQPHQPPAQTEQQGLANERSL